MQRSELSEYAFQFTIQLDVNGRDPKEIYSILRDASPGIHRNYTDTAR